MWNKNLASFSFNIKRLEAEPVDEQIQYLRADKNTVVQNITVEKYCGNDVNFRQAFDDSLKNPSDKLMLFSANMGSGKTTYMFEKFLQADYSHPKNAVLIVEPKKTNINQLKAIYKNKITAYTGNTKKTAAVTRQSKSESFVPVMSEDYLIGKDSSNIIVTVPELADEAYELILKYKGHVDFVVIDEAHDVICNLPLYRNTTGLFDMLSKTIVSNTTKIIMTTATPEPLSWICFNKIIHVTAMHPINSGVFRNIAITKTEHNRMSFDKIAAETLRREYDLTKCPKIVYFEDKKAIAVHIEENEAHGYHSICVTADNIDDNFVVQSIIDKGMLPAYDPNTNQPITFIYVTSTIISGLSIKANPELKNKQYVPYVITKNRNQLNVANIEQVVCRLRYDVPVTGHIFKAVGKPEKNNGMYALAPVDEATCKVRLSAEGAARNLFKLREFANRQTNRISLENEYGRKDRKIQMDPELLKNMSDFSVYLHAQKEHDERLYGENRLDALMEELSAHLFFTSSVFVPYIFSEYSNVLEDTKGNRKEKRKNARMAIEKMKEENIPITALFEEKPCETVRNAQDALRPYIADISNAIAIGRPDLADILLEAIASPKDVVKEIKNAKFAIEKQTLLTPVSVNVNTKTADGSFMKAPSVYEIIATKKENLYPELETLFSRIKRSDAYRSISSMSDRGMVQSIADAEEYLSRQKESFNPRALKRAADTSVLAQAYCNNLDITVTNTNEKFSHGKEIEVLMKQLYNLTASSWNYEDGHVFTNTDLNAMADMMQSVMSQFNTDTHTYEYSAHTVRRMLFDLFVCDNVSNGICVKKFAIRYLNVFFAEPNLFMLLSRVKKFQYLVPVNAA